MLTTAANAFVIAYALDAALSSLEEAVRLATGSAHLGPLRNLVAEIVVVAAVLGLPLLALTPKLPPSVFLPLMLSTLWFLIGAPPVASLISGESYGLVFCSVQLGFAAAALMRIRSLNGGVGWLFREKLFDGPLFSPRYALVFATSLVVFSVPVGLLSLAYVATSEIETQTAGFVIFDADGVALSDRRYVLGKQEIRLVGMMHLGEPDAYRDIFTSFSSESTVLLAEGVSDVDGLMNDPLSYEGVARTLGLEQQQYVTEYLSGNPDETPPRWPEVRHADLDVSDFSPETVEALERIGRVWASDSPIPAFVKLILRAGEEPELWSSLAEDVLNLRNEHLVAAIDSSLGEYERIVVPWGALHLPAIEDAVRERGFEQISSEHHRLISWTTLAAALMR